MRHAGKRHGAGRPKGCVNQTTIDKRTAEDAYRAFLQAHHQRIWTAALEAACGSLVLFRRTEAGVEQVTDPEEIARLLAQPPGKSRGQEWYLECRRPDAQLMKELQHRLMGPPTQTIDVTGTEPVTVRIVHQQMRE